MNCHNIKSCFKFMITTLVDNYHIYLQNEIFCKFVNSQNSGVKEVILVMSIKIISIQTITGTWEKQRWWKNVFFTFSNQVVFTRISQMHSPPLIFCNLVNIPISEGRDDMVFLSESRFWTEKQLNLLEAQERVQPQIGFTNETYEIQGLPNLSTSRSQMEPKKFHCDL